MCCCASVLGVVLLACSSCKNTWIDQFTLASLCGCDHHHVGAYMEGRGREGEEALVVTC